MSKVWPHFGKKKDRAITYIKIKKIEIFGLDPPIPLTVTNYWSFRKIFSMCKIEYAEVGAKLHPPKDRVNKSVISHGNIFFVFNLRTLRNLYISIKCHSRFCGQIQVQPGWSSFVPDWFAQCVIWISQSSQSSRTSFERDILSSLTNAPTLSDETLSGESDDFYISNEKFHTVNARPKFRPTKFCQTR